LLLHFVFFLHFFTLFSVFRVRFHNKYVNNFVYRDFLHGLPLSWNLCEFIFSALVKLETLKVWLNIQQQEREGNVTCLSSSSTPTSTSWFTNGTHTDTQRGKNKLFTHKGMYTVHEDTHNVKFF